MGTKRSILHRAHRCLGVQPKAENLLLESTSARHQAQQKAAIRPIDSGRICGWSQPECSTSQSQDTGGGGTRTDGDGTHNVGSCSQAPLGLEPARLPPLHQPGWKGQGLCSETQPTPKSMGRDRAQRIRLRNNVNQKRSFTVCSVSALPYCREKLEIRDRVMQVIIIHHPPK